MGQRLGWTPYHQKRGHDGGLSAAIADGAYESAYQAVGRLSFWEALHEPCWDIGWGDRGVGHQPPQAAIRTGTSEAWFPAKAQPAPRTAVPSGAEIGQAALREQAATRARYRERARQRRQERTAAEAVDPRRG